MLTQVEQTKTLSIPIVDDDHQFRAGISTLLSFSQIQDRAINVIGEANYPAVALSLGILPT